MKILIYLLLVSLLFAGCLAEEPSKVTVIDYPDEQLEDNTTTPDTTETNESPAPSKPAKSPVSNSAEGIDVFTSPWGSECEWSGDCGSFKDMTDCVKGHCVNIECKFKGDCPNADHCFNGKCYLESELYGEFSKCGVNVQCEEKCDTCMDGTRTCMVTGWSEEHTSMDYYICVECSSDYDCSEGYSCEQKYCIKSS